jgi:predicted NBD/HSP70 family sugar kinase
MVPMDASESASGGVRERNTEAVLECLRANRPASRTDLALRTGLSKPTVAGALRDLEAGGLVREYGRTTGRRGPSASLYDMVTDSVLVLGIDIGAHYIRAVLADLDAQPLQELALHLPRPTADAVMENLRAVRKEVDTYVSRIELAVVGSPGVIDPVTGRVSAAPNIDGWDGIVAERLLGDTLGLPVRVENDVNLAALGEHNAGAGHNSNSFAYLNIGSGLGAGLILNGHLHRGHRGAAGEVGFLPVGNDPFDPESRAQGGPMEARLSSHALVAVAEHLTATKPSVHTGPVDVESLFAAAATADSLGRAVVAHAARATAICIAGLTAVVDLELVLLGGGIGTNSQLLLPDVREATARLVPAPPDIRCASLGDRAVRVGAVAVALEAARHSVVHRLVHNGNSSDDERSTRIPTRRSAVRRDRPGRMSQPGIATGRGS